MGVQGPSNPRSSGCSTWWDEIHSMPAMQESHVSLSSDVSRVREREQRAAGDN